MITMATRESIDVFIKNLRSFKSGIKIVEKEILDELSSQAESEIQTSVSTSNYEDCEPITVKKEGKGKKRKVGIYGVQAIYDEFGTGTVGQNNPHPEKGNYDLNDYNTGRTIRENAGINSAGNNITEATRQGIPLNGLYWTYKYNGKKIYTQGRPAGMHVYKGHNKVKQVMKKIINDKVRDELSKL